MRRVYLRQVRVERSETTEPFTATARRASEASHPARPTNVKKRPKGAFLLSAVRDLTPGGTAFARPTVSAVRFVGRVSEAPPDMPMSTFSLKLSKKMPI